MSPTDRLRLTATALYTGERFNSSGERDLLDDYIRVDLSGSYTLSAQAEAFFRVENLLDEDYEEILNFGTAERSGYAGLRVKF
jgi:vitamin B12 transporter